MNLAAIWNGYPAEVNQRVQLEKGSPEAIADARKRLKEAINAAQDQPDGQDDDSHADDILAGYAHRNEGF